MELVHGGRGLIYSTVFTVVSVVQWISVCKTCISVHGMNAYTDIRLTSVVVSRNRLLLT